MRKANGALSIALPVSLFTLLSAGANSFAADTDTQSLRTELESLKRDYEARISALEERLRQLESPPQPGQSVPATATTAGSNTFNPAIGLILNGRYATFAEDDGEFSGFAPGEEGERGSEGLSIGESELNLGANIDNRFTGSLKVALVREEGEDIIELEEAYIGTLPGAGLPFGTTLRAGRALWTLGYLNEHHTHTDDFADRPLPYRVFLNNAFNDDGLEVSYVLPTDLYTEIGGGLFRGDDFPFGGAEGGDIGAWSAFTRIGGDLGENHSWRIGGYLLTGEAPGGRSSHEDEVQFAGDSDLYAADLRYTWTPFGNPRGSEFTFQAEYFRRYEDGVYEDFNAETGAIAVDSHDSGWYLQGVYRFDPQWRVGFRYSELTPPAMPTALAGSVLAADGHKPRAYALMTDWSNSEFSRLRLQFNREELRDGQDDNQLILQYIMSLGAHGAHKF